VARNVDVDLDQAAIKSLLLDKRVGKELLTVAKLVGLTAYGLAHKRYPLHEYAASIKEDVELTASGWRAYVSADKDALVIEYGARRRTKGRMPRLRILGKALEFQRKK
jgi:hypothetical protein